MYHGIESFFYGKKIIIIIIINRTISIGLPMEMERPNKQNSALRS